jgi:AcrR family transcriptional regulator
MNLAAKLSETRRQEAVDAIAETAVELFARDGYEATSVDVIARAAGCSPRTFYRYFKTKEDVMFYDLPEALAGLEEKILRHLAHGSSRWDAVCATLIDLISRFERSDEQAATRRMALWLSEPALRISYMHYIVEAEQVVARCLHTHSGTTPHEDDSPELIAVTATGAYRITVITHNAGGKLVEHLRGALDRVGEGVAKLGA